MITLDIMIEAGDWSRLEDAEALAQKAAEAALAVTYEADGDFEASVMLTDDAQIQELNRTWRNKDKPTNVLSFPAGPGAGSLGDIAVSLGVVRREAAAEGRALAAHFAHLVIHGTLHLLGHDHLAAGGAMLMERAEARILHRLRLPNPWRARWMAA